MNQENPSSSIGPMLLTFIAGVAVGAVIAALVTPKSGPELRGDLKDVAARAKRKAADLARDASDALDGLKELSLVAAADLKRGLADSVTRLKQPVKVRSKGPDEGLNWDGNDGG